MRVENCATLIPSRCNDLLSEVTEVQEPESFTRLMRFAGKQRREVSNPCLTANNAIEIANYIEFMLSKKDDYMQTQSTTAAMPIMPSC